MEEITTLSRLSSIPVVVGGGVKLADMPSLARTGVAGFFVVSAISEADDPGHEAANLVKTWNSHKR